jgi:hypothetical protein
VRAFVVGFWMLAAVAAAGAVVGAGLPRADDSAETTAADPRCVDGCTSMRLYGSRA